MAFLGIALKVILILAELTIKLFRGAVDVAVYQFKFSGNNLNSKYILCFTRSYNY